MTYTILDIDIEDAVQADRRLGDDVKNRFEIAPCSVYAEMIKTVPISER